MFALLNHFRATAALLGVSVVLAAAGCSGGVKTVPVSGKVTLGGVPVSPEGEGWSGTVTYHPDEEKGTKAGGPLLLGTIGEQGAYAISGGGKAGVPPGWYKVTVDIKKSGNPKDPYALPTPLVGKQFTDPKLTPLSKEVKADAPEGAYDLPVSK